MDCCKNYDPIRLQNCSYCLSAALNDKSHISSRYTLLEQAFRDLLNTSDFGNISRIINEIYPHLLCLLNRMDNPIDCVQNLQEFILSYYNTCDINKELQAMFMQQLFYKNTDFAVSISETTEMVFESLYHDDLSVQKYGMSLLLQLLQFVFSHYSELLKDTELSEKEKYEWLAERKRKWELYISIFDTINEYAAHLIKQVWSRIQQLLDVSPMIPLLAISTKWIELLYYRGLNHSNPQVKLLILSILFSSFDHPGSFIPSITFVSTTLVSLLNQGVLFKGNLYGIAFPMVCFLRFYHQNLSENDQLILVHSLLRTLIPSITNPIALQFLIGFMDTSVLPPKPVVLSDSTNASATGTELLSMEHLDRLYASSISWRGCLTSELVLLWSSLVDKLVAQVSYLPLQRILIHSVLHLVLQNYYCENCTDTLFKTFTSFVSRFGDRDVNDSLERMKVLFNPVKDQVEMLSSDLYQAYISHDDQVLDSIILVWRLGMDQTLLNCLEATQMNERVIELVNKFWQYRPVSIQWSGLSECEKQVKSIDYSQQYCNLVEFLMNLHSDHVTGILHSIKQPTTLREKYFLIILYGLLPQQVLSWDSSILSWFAELLIFLMIDFIGFKYRHHSLLQRNCNL